MTTRSRSYVTQDLPASPAAAVKVSAGTNGGQGAGRTSMIIQNNLLAGGGNLYVGYQPNLSVQAYLVIMPGGSILRDFACPQDDIFMWADVANSNGTIWETWG